MYHIVISERPMIPIKLSLKNFLSYGDNSPVLDFENFRIACLSGKNGHGKSAILDAMTWSMWGKCRVSSNVDIIKRGETEALVEFEFEVEGTRYRIIRSLKRKKGTETSGSLNLQYFNETTDVFVPLEQGRKTQAVLEKILKMDYDSFICSSFILQGRADEFMKKSPAERKAVLSKILDLDKFEELGKRARAASNLNQRDVQSLKDDAERISDQTKREDHIKPRLTESQTTFERVNETVETLEGKMKELVRKSEELRARSEKYDALGSERKITESSIADISSRFEELEKQIRQHESLTSKEEDINEGFAQFETAKGRERDYSEKLLTHSKLTKEYEGLRSAIKDERSKIEKQIGGFEGRAREIERAIGQKREFLGREAEIAKGYDELQRSLDLEKEFEKKRRGSSDVTVKLTEAEGKLNEIRYSIDAHRGKLEEEIRDKHHRSEGIGEIRTDIAEKEKSAQKLENYKLKSDKLKEEVKLVTENKRESLIKSKELKRRLKEDRDKLDLLNTEAGVEAHCPLCESPLGIEARDALSEKIERSVACILADMDTEKKRSQELSTTEARLTGEIRELEGATARIPALSALIAEKKIVLKEAMVLIDELPRLQDELSTVKTRLKSKDYGHEIQTIISLLKKQIETIGYDLSKHDRQKSELEALRRFQSEKELLDKSRSELTELQYALDTTTRERQGLLKVLKDKNFAHELRAKAAVIEDRMNETGYDEDEHWKIKSELKRLERFAGEKDELERAKLNLRHNEKEMERLKAECGERSGRLRAIVEEISTLEGAVAESRQVDETRVKCERELIEEKSRRDEVLSQMALLKNELVRIEELKETKKEIDTKLGKLNYEVGIYKELQRAFGKNGIQALIIENAVPEIEREANVLLAKLTDGTMTLALELVEPTQKGGEKETLQIKIADSSGTRNYETFSGGESFRIDFALRVAMSKFIANRSGAELRTLVIDEGFGTQDSEGLSNFVDVINAVKDDFDKILVITHIEELKNKFPVRIEVRKEYGKGSTFESVYN